MSILGRMSHKRAQVHLEAIKENGLTTWIRAMRLDPEKFSVSIGAYPKAAFNWMVRGDKPSARGEMQILNALMAGKVQQAEEG